ncbi:Glucose-induced degradation protein 4 [Madurella mycetomatis]|uniref:Glucose-induced degradation protein 4 n=1 Tax=Madurella mycetomatis TaxID=100816 RepID=A0A175WBI6_9PEZI|nr:Glucose-induced degradation protein 4 [Madurella mycetomatis]
MPTPSSNAPDPQSPRSFPFSSCPDLEEQQAFGSTSQIQLQATAPPESPSRWRPLQSPAHLPGSESRANRGLNDDLATSRSVTMSPRTEIESVRDVDMERETEGMVIAQDGTDESHKRTDMDDDMLAMANVPSRGGIGGGGAVVAGNREVARTSSGDGLGRGQQSAGRFPQVVGEIHEVDVWGPIGKGPRWVEDSGLVGLGNEYSHMRIIPTPPSSYLRPGSRFEGQQQSERQRYDVEVEIKHVDLRESFLCGYLRIQGLTDDHPTLTTYFEGEIIGSKYGFITQHPSWGATEKIDLSHWAKFTAFRPYAKQTRKGGQIFIGDVAQRENIFMRWKEHFLVPDHRVRTINGASFEGFYYICFNQVRGEVSGIYFHSKSEKFQQLDLKHVDDKGCYGAMEFR